MSYEIKMATPAQLAAWDFGVTAGEVAEWESQSAGLAKSDYDCGISQGRTNAQAAEWALRTYRSLIAGDNTWAEHADAWRARVEFDADGPEFVAEMFSKLSYGSKEWQAWAPIEDFEAWFEVNLSFSGPGGAEREERAEADWLAFRANQDSPEGKAAELKAVERLARVEALKTANVEAAEREAVKRVKERSYLLERFADVETILNGGVTVEEPTIGRRHDGEHLFYPGKINSLIGPPESGKTWVALALAAEVLIEGGRVLWIDIDHNGASGLVSKLLALGAPRAALADLGRFRLAEPGHKHEVLDIVSGFDLAEFSPTLAVLDSIGELVPMFGGSSNSDDDWTQVNRDVLVPMADAGAAVVTIDHVAKNLDSAKFGATGTQAKKRSVNGSMIRVTVKRAFAPGRGGRADLTIVKDRPGGLRAVSEERGGGREPQAAAFELTEKAAGQLGWAFWEPDLTSPAVTVAAASFGVSMAGADAAQLATLSPAPTSVRDVRERMVWGTERASQALRSFREKESHE